MKKCLIFYINHTFIIALSIIKVNQKGVKMANIFEDFFNDDEVETEKVEPKEKREK